jgi:hypothetical protein
MNQEITEHKNKYRHVMWQLECTIDEYDPLVSKMEHLLNMLQGAEKNKIMRELIVREIAHALNGTKSSLNYKCYNRYV